LELESESVGVGVVFEMVELVRELWELVVSVVVVIVDSFVGLLVLFGREGGKYIAFNFESVSPLPMCISRPKSLNRWKIRLVPWTRSSLVAKGKKVSSTYGS
jgi:hypothetical protein